ncbi:hypothetical protein BDA99DRAFT_498017 [Phascolomyces articulosus]|uniref:Exosome complex protein n=1 Tax=Phascolomyces articulosus TaxID=60185 RepID=A0AAD5K8Q9_9FUNG|nr:hypothetical protein BDA99DRAFT_498017 [Phascolomyces articulosus]
MDPKQEQIAKKAAKALKSRIDLIQKHLDPILAGPLSETYGQLPTNEKAQFEVLLSYTLNTLCHIYLKTYGVDPIDHQVTNELRRIKQYIEKIKAAEGRGPKRTMELDKDAADRFIKSALAGEDEDQNQEASTSTKKRPLRKEKSRTEEDEEAATADQQEDVSNNNDNNVKRKRARVDPFVGPRNGSY